ncbi:MAG: SET domain-containing protein-lysine N-methyltransferase [Chloroflexota bacterium]|nr:SET domain-containing protein-lysine N-methyltransferase [Chloroflexota bacterium]
MRNAEYAMITEVIVQATGGKGQGVFALRAFSKGEFIFRRRHGRVVANSDINLLSADDQRHLCELDWATSAVLLAPGCYLNHSCNPNAMRKGTNVYAWQTIRQGEEITIDYRLNAFSADRWDCVCGSHNCLGYVIGSFFALAPDIQRTYLPYAPSFIRAEYHRRLQAATVSPRRRAS